jgi:hypothetical protein
MVGHEKIAYSARHCWQSERASPFFEHPLKEPIMEAERVNTIRSQLEDLTTRVVELRRYL